MQSISLLLVVLTVAFVYGQQCPRCTPYCFNGDGSAKLCGNDGCGGSCGTCSSGQECCRGRCACAPNCQGRQCGDDGCGGNSCGSCANGQTCSNGVCVGTGARTCEGRVCGHDRIGGSCGSCPAGQRCRGGVCECYYDCNDRNCGTAPQEAGSFCPSQTCGTCPSGFTCDTNGRCSALAPCSVNLVVIDTTTSVTVSGSCSIDITGVSLTYTSNGFRWSPPSTPWDVGGGFGTYSFRTTCTGYQVSVEQHSVTTSTTTVTLRVTPANIPVEVREAGVSTQLTVTCSITATNGAGYFSTFSWTANTGVVFTGVSTAGYGTYEFQTTCPGYQVSTESMTLTTSTTVIQLTVRRNAVVIEVRERASNALIRESATISISLGAQSFGTYNWVSGITNNWAVPGGFGTYTFNTVTFSYSPSLETRVVDASTSIVILYVAGCGDDECTDGEDWTSCKLDCARVNLEFYDWGGNNPINEFQVSLFESQPRLFDGSFGPTRNSAVQPSLVQRANAGSNVWDRGTFDQDFLIYIEVVATGYVTFYWTADLTRINHQVDFFKLRGHMATTFNSQSFPYKLVTTWRTADDEPSPYAPVDVNLHVFFGQPGTTGNGACDLNNKVLTVNGNQKCLSNQDAKQSGGPASVEFTLDANEVITSFVAVPPRDFSATPDYNNRYLVNSDSFIVLYGITQDAATGKQLAEVTLAETLNSTPGSSSSLADVWRAADWSVSSPRVSGATLKKISTLKFSTINSRTRVQSFSCELYSHCFSFTVPYADAGARK